MDALVINGPAKLKGEVRVSGSKNTALPLLFSAILFDEPIQFENVPRLWDIETTLSLLEHMGVQSQWDKENGKIAMVPKVTCAEAPYEWVKKMRAGILALGPLVAKCGKAKVSLPGGCAIGARPVNFHLEALKQMGVSIEVEEGYIHAKVANRLQGAVIIFPQVTVTGTENIMMAAALAEGQSILENAACEPEVVALGELLISAGCKMEGLGTPTIRIQGGKLTAPKKPVVIPPDRIEAGTWISAAVATRSPLKITHIDASHMDAIIEAFRQMGAKIEIRDGGKSLFVEPAEKYHSIHLETEAYPGFATDMQAQILLNTCLAEGVSEIRETIFENRFMHVAELRRLGAKIEIAGNLALIEGPTELKGAPVMATDLRASASLVLAALCAKGQTKISRIYHLDRGYQRLDEKLRALGVDVTRISE